MKCGVVRGILVKTNLSSEAMICHALFKEAVKVHAEYSKAVEVRAQYGGAVFVRAHMCTTEIKK